VTDSIGEQLRSLQFTSGPVETLYLNENRVRDDFLGQIGAIESFTRSATKQGSVSGPLPILSIGGGVGAEAGVTWTLTDVTAQALVLREALERRGELADIRSGAPGGYVQAQGRGRLSGPEMRAMEHQAALSPTIYDELEGERAQQEQVLRMIDKPDAKMWLLTVHNDDLVVAAAVLDNRWLKPSSPSWLVSDNVRWNVFARMRGGKSGPASRFSPRFTSP
jgi:hypothetical protein